MDRLLRWVRDIRQARFFDIQNVADYFWHHTEEHWDLKTMTLAPPFDFFATRYTLPARSYSKEYGWVDFPKETHGSECLTVFRVVDSVPVIHRGNDIYLSATGVQTGAPQMIPGARWLIDIHMFMALHRHVDPPTRWFLAVDERGRVGTQKSGEPAFWLTENLNDRDPMTIIPVSYLHVSGLALTFMNCRNVEMLPAYPEPGKVHRARKRVFQIRWHRLKVNAIGQKRQSATGLSLSKSGIKQSLHIVRGAFRHYGPASVSGHPEGKDTGLLFGKRAGKFWVAAHFKGDPQVGVVDKDYEVEAPPEK